MNILYKVALTIAIIGAINWLLIGLLDVNLVTLLFGIDSVMTNIVYILVGISGLICTGILLKPLDDVHHK
jgi:uncharacterized membrane protein YuzA (DUF378 family)